MPVAAKLLPAHVVRVPERPFRVADGRGVLVGHVGSLRLVNHGLALQRFLHVNQRGKRLVLHLDCLRRILGQIAALRQHHRQRVAHVVNLAVSQRILQEFQQVAVRPQSHRNRARLHRRRDVLEGQHVHHARHLPRRRRVDGYDPRVGMRAAHDGGVQRVRQPNVVHELPPAGQKPPVFPPPDGRANVLLRHSGPLFTPECARNLGIAEIMRSCGKKSLCTVFSVCILQYMLREKASKNAGSDFPAAHAIEHPMGRHRGVVFGVWRIHGRASRLKGYG